MNILCKYRHKCEYFGESSLKCAGILVCDVQMELYSAEQMKEADAKSMKRKNGESRLLDFCASEGGDRGGRTN